MNALTAKGEALALLRSHVHSLPFPKFLHLEPTNACPLRCVMCPRQEGKRPVGFLRWSLFKRIADECAARGPLDELILHKDGEPLLHPTLPRMIAYAKERGFIDVMFHTNGTIMTEPLARALLDSNLDRIIFSVDSPDKATYEAMRIRSNWDKVVANVRFFAELRQRLGRTMPLIRTTMVMTDKTAHQVQDFVKLWKPLADQITLQDLTWRAKVLESGEWKNREQSAVPADMDEIRSEAKKHKLSFVCPYLYQSAYTFWNGDVIPCSNPNARKYMVMGRLDQQSFHEIWHGKAYQELRILHESGRWDEHPICRDCEIPLIELYKALEKDGVKFASAQPTDPEAPLLVASGMVPKGQEAVDLVTKFQQALSKPLTAPPASSSEASSGGGCGGSCHR